MESLEGKHVGLYRVFVKEDPNDHEMLTEVLAKYSQKDPPWASQALCRWHVHGTTTVGVDCHRRTVKQILDRDDMAIMSMPWQGAVLGFGR